MTDDVRQKAIALYDRYTHEGMERRDFMKRMAVITFDAIFSTDSLISDRSRLETFGNRDTTSRCSPATAAGPLTVERRTYCLGADSSVGGENTAKKFG